MSCQTSMHLSHFIFLTHILFFFPNNLSLTGVSLLIFIPLPFISPLSVTLFISSLFPPSSSLLNDSSFVILIVTATSKVIACISGRDMREMVFISNNSFTEWLVNTIFVNSCFFHISEFGESLTLLNTIFTRCISTSLQAVKIANLKSQLPVTIF